MWRKVLPVFRFSILKKIFLLLLILNFFVIRGIAQSLEMPELSMPEFPSMPDVSAPVTGSENFYRPEIPNFGKNKQTEDKQNLTNPKKELTLSSADDATDLLNNLLYGNNVLSAKDISSLSDVGMFDTLSSLQGTNYSLLSQTSSNDVLLRQILFSLDDLKKAQSANLKLQPEIKKEIEKDSEVFKKRTPSILRFTINGYDMVPSLATVFFSEAEEDGTFLLTGDRKYYADRKNHSETFYLLFRAEKSSNKSLNYKICPSLVQDSKNEKSFLYQLSQKSDITATKTGNLVVVHYSQNNWNMDLLLDIDCKGKQ